MTLKHLTLEGLIMETGYKVCDAMTEKPIVVTPETTVIECSKHMSKHHVGSLMIMDKNELLGLITEQDIVRNCVALDLNPKKTTVKEVMVKELETISPEKDIYEALVLMKDQNIRQLPVMDGKEMVGLLTLKDILKIEPQLFDLLVEKFELREEQRKPIFNVGEKEGICQICGEYTSKLHNVDDAMVCIKCAKTS